MQSIVAWSRTELVARSAARRSMSMGTGSTRRGGESFFFQAEYIRVNLKSCFPALSSLGSTAPNEGNFWLTSRMASSTEQARLGLPLGAMRPSRQRRPKT